MLIIRKCENTGDELKQLVKAIIPRTVLRFYRGFLRAIESRHYARLDPREVFQKIYFNAKWGGDGNDFCSGSGSTTATVVEPYVEAVTRILNGYGTNKPKIVDLGCGDFRVGRRFLDHCSEYVAVDVVPELIKCHEANHCVRHLRFECLDIIRDPLPKGDVVFLRQVLQHLSNAEIITILNKLSAYDKLIVTEHYPTPGRKNIVANLDKVHGPDIRLYHNSGVYLDKPPFCIAPARLDLLLEVASPVGDPLYDPGIIRTYVVRRALEFRN